MLWAKISGHPWWPCIVAPCPVSSTYTKLLPSRYCLGVSVWSVSGYSSLWKSPHCYGKSHVLWDHTVLPATRQRWLSCLYPSQSWYSIYRRQRDAWLSWPSCWLQFPRQFTCQRQSPVLEINNQSVSWLGGEPSTATRESDVLTTRPPSHPETTHLLSRWGYFQCRVG